MSEELKAMEAPPYDIENNCKAAICTLLTLSQKAEESDTLRRQLAEQTALAERMRDKLTNLNHAAKVCISTEWGGSFEEETPLTVRLLDGTCEDVDEFLARTPAAALDEYRREVRLEAYRECQQIAGEAEREDKTAGGVWELITWQIEAMEAADIRAMKEAK